MRENHDRKQNILLIIAIVLTIAWMGVIFSMSAAKAETSSSMSMKVGRAVGHLVVNDFSSLSEKEKDAFAMRISFPVRKTAHFLEYTVLGLLLAADAGLVVRGYRKNMWIAPALIGIAYACTDEFHQMFVSGRSAQFRDVLIDAGGVLCGLFLLFILCRKFGIIYNTRVKSS